MEESYKPAIIALIDEYFRGIFCGDITALEKVFHPDCRLYGEVGGSVYAKTLQEYLRVVEERKSPKSLGEKFTMEIMDYNTPEFSDQCLSLKITKLWA
ncbi:nuclear transport factor 2 family protein [Fulvitalea axinellae]